MCVCVCVYSLTITARKEHLSSKQLSHDTTH